DAGRCLAYDTETGVGDHYGLNVKGWHRHAPRVAKYVNFGDNQRIDFGPGGLAAIKRAYAAGTLWPGLGLGIEGKMKHLAAESNGWFWVSVASITLWDEGEMRRLARWMREQIPG